jgi:rubrerythrin
MPDTEQNLKSAFAGESQANRKYLAFANKAERDGFPNVARLFRATAEAETIHAHGHLRALDGVKSTADNLLSAVDGETYEFSSMYPPMLEQAVKEGHKAKLMFGYAVEAEKVHAERYKTALEAVLKGRDINAPEVYLCPVCGHIEFGKPDNKCPICGIAPGKYVKVD